MIEKIRKKKGVSRYRLAQATGIDMSTLWRYERGKSVPGVRNLKKIANFLNVKIDDLI